VSIITLTTDFGTSDWFVGTMKGVIAGINPRANVVDITHEVAAGDIRSGAFALAASYCFFPKNTIHVAVVDPGVGTRRKAIAVQTTNYLFVSPDNGVLSFALGREKIKAIRLLSNERLFLPDVSRTFHGRDVFAPVAAHLSQGRSLKRLGPAANRFVKLDWPRPKGKGNSIEGEIVYIDRFGNAITNIDAGSVAGIGPDCELRASGKRLCPLKSSYQAVPPGRPEAVVGSCGLLEIAVNGGSAASLLGLKVGSGVLVQCRQLTRR